MSSLVFDIPSVSHALAVAWRFEDAFSGRLVDLPLDVYVDSIAPYSQMPALPWRAVRGNDASYRFLVSNRTVPPVGTLSVTADVPSSLYAAFEPLTMVLPRALAAPPHPSSSDFLIVTNLWPTRAFKIPLGETAVVGTLSSMTGSVPVAGLRISLWSSVHATPPAGTPYTYTDANGDFVTRLLGKDFRVSASGGVVTTTANVLIQIHIPPTYTTTLVPTTTFPQTVQLGQVNSLQIVVP